MSTQNWFERQVQNLYGVGTDGKYLDTSGQVGFNFRQDAASLISGEGARGITGYWHVNTGNRTFDAIATIALNELGVDNAYKAFLNAREGNYASAFKELAFMAGEIGVNATGVGRVLMSTPKLAKAVKGTFRPAVAGGQTRIAGRFGPVTPPSPAGLGRRALQAAQRTPAVAAAAYSQGALKALPALGRSAFAATKSGAGSLLPKGTRLGRLGALAVPLTYLQVARQRDPEKAAAAAAATETPEDAPRTIRDITPSGDPITDAGNAARNDVAGINRQYNNILRELQSMYQLSETDEERERLRFMLADIEAQRDAGLQAISEGYAQTVTAIRERSDITRQRTQEQAQRFGGELEGYADRTAQRMMLQNLEQQQQFRGLGSGSASPVNEWVGLMSAMAPLQQQYTQRMGDITAEGIDWMADTTSAQGQAQLADLQRLAAATRSAGIMGHQRQVADRIQRDSEALRAATLQTLMQQANAAQSGLGGVDPFDRAASIEKYALQGWGQGDIQQWLNETGQGGLTPGELERIRIRNERYIQEASKGTNNPLGN
jgi:hypothetical protein